MVIVSSQGPKLVNVRQAAVQCLQKGYNAMQGLSRVWIASVPVQRIQETVKAVDAHIADVQKTMEE